MRVLRKLSPHSTRAVNLRVRPPITVPYLVDNLWELGRPEEFPSRRSSIFALPVAGVADPAAAGFEIIDVPDTTTVFGLRTPYRTECHPDIQVLRDVVHRFLGPGWFEQAAETRRGTTIFLPTLTKGETWDCLDRLDPTGKLAALLIGRITFWTQCGSVPGDPDPDKWSELFFSLR